MDTLRPELLELARALLRMAAAVVNTLALDLTLEAELRTLELEELAHAGELEE